MIAASTGTATVDIEKINISNDVNIFLLSIYKKTQYVYLIIFFVFVNALI